MNKDIKLTESELSELSKMATSQLLKRVYDFVVTVQSNPAYKTFIALQLTHDRLCDELTEKEVKLFNEESTELKIFENYLKFQKEAESVVATLSSLKKQLMKEEEVKAISKIKDSKQLFFDKQFKNGKKAETEN